MFRCLETSQNCGKLSNKLILACNNNNNNNYNNNNNIRYFI